MHQAGVEFVAPPGFAAMDERSSTKLSLHLNAITVILAYTQRIRQFKLQHGRFLFPELGNVKVKQGTDNTDIIVRANGCKIVYQYNYRSKMVSHCTRHDEDGNPVEADLATVQASYDAVLDYCGNLLSESASQVEVPPTTEAD
ncbi:hypothetical protein PHABIO_152 [Pseudomonas phage Phabio]|uniref:Uncharacterized protein n=1 Tax=Pseudomonas phage Phabio TaxID=2006668 RepID=A0A1Y0SYG3_9CAUD|nr:hypothetical protein MZD05_gp152 [Pseudomonas phage Phabio]ARV76783.1 hypothetical protein PHABIO_152 [Pseudomonas phage Phabio]